MPVLPKTDDYVFILIPMFAEVLANDSIPERICQLRMEALHAILSRLHYYKKMGFDHRLLCAIAEKKGALAMKITTKAQLHRLKQPRGPHFDGEKFLSDEYMVPEEELIYWSETSLRAPLSEPGYRRCFELFQQVFPEMSQELAI